MNINENPEVESQEIIDNEPVSYESESEDYGFGYLEDLRNVTHTEETDDYQADASESETVVDDSSVQHEGQPNYEFLTEDFIPKSFSDEQEELAFYRSNYGKLPEVILSNEKFVEGIRDKYSEKLAEIEHQIKSEEFTQVAGLYKGLQGDTDLLLKIIAPKEIAERGLDGMISSQEAEKLRNGKIAQMYGADALSKYNEQEADIPGTLSHMILQVAARTEMEVQSHNEKVQQYNQMFAPPKPEQVRAHIEEQYETNFKDIMPREEYDRFIEQATNYKLDLFDSYFLINRDEFLKEEFNKGVEEGIRQQTNKFKSVAQTVKPQEYTKPTKQENSIQAFSSKYKFTDFRDVKQSQTN